jgi:hypothetical protein
MLSTLAITDTIGEFIEPYVSQALDLLTNMDMWMQGLVILAIGIFVIIGLFVFIKKFVKAFLVIAILGAIAYFAYSQGYLDGILSFVTGFFANTIF